MSLCMFGGLEGSKACACARFGASSMSKRHVEEPERCRTMLRRTSAPTDLLNRYMGSSQIMKGGQRACADLHCSALARARPGPPMGPVLALCWPCIAPVPDLCWLCVGPLSLCWPYVDLCGPCVLVGSAWAPSSQESLIPPNGSPQLLN